MKHRWIVTALGADRPGIVAGVTQALYKSGCNLEDSAMTRLEGEFAVMLVFTAPARSTEMSLNRAFAPVSTRLKLTVLFKRLPGRRPPASRGRPFVISVYGADHPGIVYKIAEALARMRVNITDVETHRSVGASGRKRPLYLMLIAADVPARRSAAALERRLRVLAKQLRVELTIRSADANLL